MPCEQALTGANDSTSGVEVSLLPSAVVKVAIFIRDQLNECLVRSQGLQATTARQERWPC
jgi:hypothetical protein